LHKKLNKPVSRETDAFPNVFLIDVTQFVAVQFFYLLTSAFAFALHWNFVNLCGGSVYFLLLITLPSLTFYCLTFSAYFSPGT